MDLIQSSVTLTLTEPLLGTVPRVDVYQKFVETKKPDTVLEDESTTIDETEAKGWTGFHRDDTGLFLYDYQIKGMLKELARVAFPKDNVASLKAVVSKIEQFVYVRPRRVYLGVTTADDTLERPLRAQTMQGPRVTVVRSDTIAAGRTITFEVHILPGPIKAYHLDAILQIGEYRGIGQWRSGGYGRFTYVRS